MDKTYSDNVRSQQLIFLTKLYAKQINNMNPDGFPGYNCDKFYRKLDYFEDPTYPLFFNKIRTK